MTLNLKLSAIKLLLTESQPMEAKAAVYLMASGAKGIPDSVTKGIMMNIIIFLCAKLEWIEEDKNPSAATVVNEKTVNDIKSEINQTSEEIKKEHLNTVQPPVDNKDPLALITTEVPNHCNG